jgi:short-subunit dehydrogenase
VSLLEQFAARFEERGEGFIAAISSVAGDRGRQSNYIYGASKAGLSAYLEGLRNRLYHRGVHVTTIKPGFVDTKMTFGLPGLFLVASPQQAAKAMYAAIVKKKNTAYVPWFWRYIMLIIRHVPDWQFKKMRM